MKKYTKYKSRLEASKAFDSNGFKLTVLEHPQSQVGLEYFIFAPFRKEEFFILFLLPKFRTRWALSASITRGI